MTRELLPSQIGCIDLEWLFQKVKEVNEKRSSATELLQVLVTGGVIFPFTPLLEDAYMKGFKDAMCTDCKDFETYIQSPIKINTNES